MKLVFMGQLSRAEAKWAEAKSVGIDALISQVCVNGAQAERRKRHLDRISSREG